MNTSHFLNECDFQMNMSQFEADLFVRYNFQPKFSPTQVVKCFQFTFSPYRNRLKSGRQKKSGDFLRSRKSFRLLSNKLPNMEIKKTSAPADI